MAWEACDIYQTYEQEGAEAAAKKLGFTIGTAVIGGVAVKGAFILGSFACKTAGEAILHYKQAHPVFARLYDIAARGVANGIQKYKKLDTKLDAAWHKRKEKVGAKIGAKSATTSTFELESKAFQELALGAESSTSKYWNKHIEFKGNKVYQRNDLIDPDLINKKGISNLQRMEKGQSPYGPDGQKIELHHMLQTQTGPLAEVTSTFHKSNSSIIHINTLDIPSGIDRSIFKSWRENYLKNRVQDFKKKE